MKSFTFAVLFAAFVPLLAEEAEPDLTTSQALRTGKIAKFELNKATFEQALEQIRVEWMKQYPKLGFPVALADYEEDRGYPNQITMSLSDVPFIVAIKYVGESSRRRLVERSGLLTLEEVGMIVEDWTTKLHEAPDSVLVGLGLGENPTSNEIKAAYSRFGVKFEDWMAITYKEGKIIVMAFESQHEQIGGINFLLSKGYKITKGE